MVKKVWVSCIVCGLLLMNLSSCNQKKEESVNNTVLVSEKSSNSSEKYQRDMTPGRTIPIKIKDIEKLVQNKKEFTIVLTLTSCTKCQIFESMFEDYKMIHHVDLYKIVLDEEEGDEDALLNQIHKFFPDFESTPTLYYVKNGSIVDTCQTDLFDEATFDQWVQQHQIDKKTNGDS